MVKPYTVDEAKSAVDQFQAQRKWQTLQIKQYEDRRDRAENAAERKQLEDAISSLKSQLETLSPEGQEAQAKEIELEQELRTEQAKLDQLHDALDRLDRAVTSAAFRPGSAPQWKKRALLSHLAKANTHRTVVAQSRKEQASAAVE